MAAAVDGEKGSDRVRRVILLGPPNSGKGTQAAVLAQELAIPAISTGEMLRSARGAGDDLGQRVAEIMTKGGLVDDETMARVVEGRLRQPDAREGFLLDGYPRTRVQVADLERILAGGPGIDAVVVIRVPEEELVRRGLARKREDDTEEVIRERLRVYREETEPLVGYYGNLGLLHEVDGFRPIEEVSSRLLAALGLPSRKPNL